VSGRRNFALWVAALYGAVLIVLLCAAALLGAGLPAEHAAALGAALEGRSGALALGALVLLFVCAGAVRWFFGAYVMPPRALNAASMLIQRGSSTAAKSSRIVFVTCS